MRAYNLDGREFIQQAVKDLDAALNATAEPKPKHTFKTFDHFVMNLPATAIEFLGTFRLLHADALFFFFDLTHPRAQQTPSAASSATRSR